MRLGQITARPLVARPRISRHIFSKPFIEPAGYVRAIAAIKNEVGNLMAQGVAGELVGRIAEEKETPSRMNPAGPAFQFTDLLEFGPVLRSIKNVDVRFAIARR